MKKRMLITTVAVVAVVAIALGILLVTGVFDCGKSMSVTYSIPKDDNDMLTFGNIFVDCSTEKILEDFDYGDVLKVTVDGCESISVPLCGDYGDVSPGELLIYAKEGASTISIGINYGQLGVKLGILGISPEGAEKPYYAIEEKFPCNVTFSLETAGGYLERLSVGKLSESTERSSYPNLSDEDYANFRSIHCGTISDGILYRSSSPIESTLGRNEYADKAMEAHSIASVLNMQNTKPEAVELDGYEGSYYSTVNVFYYKMSIAFNTQAFNDDIYNCLRFFVTNDGPYLIHCIYGKDRTGFLCAVIEALCGATMEEIQEDYLKTYENIFDVADGIQQTLSDSIKKTISNIIIENMSYAFGTEVTAENINSATEAYALKIGFTEEDIQALRAKLK